MATIKNGFLVLSNGRQVPAGSNNVTIQPSLELKSGWNSDFLVLNKKREECEGVAPVYNPDNLDKDDIHEIADYMIGLWIRLKENIRSHGLESAQIFCPQQ